jgi:hypothetical protein
MTVTQIVKDLLEHNMITIEAAAVLLDAELKANQFNNISMISQTNPVFQPYYGVSSGNTSNPYYISTTTNDPIMNRTTAELSVNANELIKTH